MSLKSFDYGAGVDLSATKTVVIIGNSAGEVYAERIEQTDKSSPEAPSRQVIRLINDACEMTRIGSDKLDGIGVGCVGPYDADRGAIVHTSNMGHDVIPVTGPIYNAFKKRVLRGGDVFTAAHGDYEFGLNDGERTGNFGEITMSTGIGGGFMVDGRFLRGSTGDAGHVGHFTVDYRRSAPKCGCKDRTGKQRRGHWEAHCSGTAVARRGSEAIYQSSVSTFDRFNYPLSALDIKDMNQIVSARTGETVPNEDALARLVRSEDVYEAARRNAGGPWMKLVDDINHFNAIGFAAVVDAYNPDTIVVMGGVTNDWDIIGPYLDAHLAEHCILKTPSIIRTRLGARNGAMGGLALLKWYDEL